jgi:hypothetical protein
MPAVRYARLERESEETPMKMNISIPSGPSAIGVETSCDMGIVASPTAQPQQFVVPGYAPLPEFYTLTFKKQGFSVKIEATKSELILMVTDILTTMRMKMEEKGTQREQNKQRRKAKQRSRKERSS